MLGAAGGAGEARTEESAVKLYDYWRSSAAYRVRIGLNLKGLDYQPVFTHLARGEQQAPEYAAINPQMLIPTLIDGEATLTQSLAILGYLDERHPEPPLMPDGPEARARVRALALTVACEIHPLNNMSVLEFLTDTLGVDEAGKRTWYHRWIGRGFAALEAKLAGSSHTGTFCHGDAPTLADVLLVPQVYNARRWECDLALYPTIVRIERTCLDLGAFDRARPENQPDAE